MSCDPGNCPPWAKLNGCRLAGVSTSCAVVETNSVTPIVIGLFTTAAPVAGLVAVIVRLPLQVPAARPPGATDTVRVSFVTPVNELLALAACSQVDPQVVVATDTE